MKTSRLDRAAIPVRTPQDAALMSAIVQDRYGVEPEDVLRLTSTDRPRVTDTQVLVQVHAASVDRGTWHVMAGLPYPIRLAGFGVRRPRSLNPGRSLAGTVAAVGAEVRGREVGEDVFGIGEAAFAEYAVATPDKLARKPESLSYVQAAALPVSGLTALQAVRDHAEVRSGDEVLVLGAAGGVGSFAVQIAKALGAQVTGVCSTTKLARVTALGADHVIDYTVEDVTGSGQRFDVILDTGGNTPLRQLRRALTAHGRLVIVGGETDGRLLGGSGRQVRASLLSPFLRQQLGTFIASENARDLQALSELVEAGALAPAVDRTYPLGDAPAALRRLLAGQVSGKVVLAVGPGPIRTPGSRSTS